jgi:hypothetical protein
MQTQAHRFSFAMPTALSCCNICLTSILRLVIYFPTSPPYLAMSCTHPTWIVWTGSPNFWPWIVDWSRPRAMSSSKEGVRIFKGGVGVLSCRPYNCRILGQGKGRGFRWFNQTSSSRGRVQPASSKRKSKKNKSVTTLFFRENSSYII